MNHHLTGGPLYHWRAWRYSRSLWGTFRTRLNVWLTSRKPTATTLIWVGPSAGYTVMPKALVGFDQVVAVDVDPLARLLWRLRWPRIKVTWIGSDLFQFHQADTQMSGFVDLLRRYPDAEIWFSNILGQVAYLTQNPALTDRQLKLLQSLVSERSWLSYHDVVSCTLPSAQKSRDQWLSPEPVTLDALATTFFTPAAALEVFDHGTNFLAADKETPYLLWQLTPQCHQVIACVDQRTGAPWPS